MSDWIVDAVSPDGTMGTRYTVTASTETGARRKARAEMPKNEKGWTLTVSPVRRMP